MVAFAVLFSTLYVSARAHKVSKFPYGDLITGKYDNTIVNDAGHTGKQILNLITEWARINGHEMSDDNNSCFNLSQIHQNTGANKNGIYSFVDRTPSGIACGWEKALWKEECCNLVADNSNKASLISLINRFNASNGNLVVIPDQTRKDDGCSSCNENKQQNKKDTMDTSKIVLIPGDQVASGSTPWGWIIGILALLIILGMVLAFLANNREPRNGGNAGNNNFQQYTPTTRNDQYDKDQQQAEDRVLRQQASFINHYLYGIERFNSVANNMNLSSSENAQRVHNTWTNVNQPKPPQPPANLQA